jgi:site-specific recombinase XerD
MARIALEKKTHRAQLTARREPYWGAPLARGLFLGFRRAADGGTWIARQRDHDGKQHYESLGNAEHVPYDDAVTAAQAFGKRIEGGITDEVETVEAACVAYVANRLREKGEKNANGSAGLFRNHVYTHTLGQTKLARVRQDDIEAWRAGLAMKDVSKNRVLAALKAALNYAVRRRWVGAERAVEWASVKDHVAKTRRQVYLEPAERKALLAAMPDHAQPFVRALCLLPLRPGAMAMLTAGDLDKRHRMLTVGHEKTDDKNHGGRVISLSGAAFDLLAAGCKGKLPGAPIFTDANGIAWNKDSWKLLFTDAREAAQVHPQTVAYSLRHSTITDMLAGGVDSLTVARIAGTSIQKIEEHYGHLIGKHAALAVEVLAKLEAAA